MTGTIKASCSWPPPRERTPKQIPIALQAIGISSNYYRFFTTYLINSTNFSPLISSPFHGITAKLPCAISSTLLIHGISF